MDVFTGDIFIYLFLLLCCLFNVWTVFNWINKVWFGRQCGCNGCLLKRLDTVGTLGESRESTLIFQSNWKSVKKCLFLKIKASYRNLFRLLNILSTDILYCNNKSIWMSIRKDRMGNVRGSTRVGMRCYRHRLVQANWMGIQVCC